MKDYSYVIVLNKSELVEVLDALYLASTEWGEPSKSKLGAIALKIRGQIADEQATERCNDIVDNVR